MEGPKVENWCARDTSLCITCKKRVLISSVMSMSIMSHDMCIFCSPTCTLKWAHEMIEMADKECEELETEHKLIELGCPGEECLACTGEACRLCGAGCWAPPNSVQCDHDVIDRHQTPKD